MAGTLQGALKNRASHVGLSVDELLAREEAGEFWCYRCREFHPREAFGNDSTRSDGRERSCKAARNGVARTRYVTGYRRTRRRSLPLLTSEERGRRISDGKKGRPNGRLGKKHTLATRLLISTVTRERTPRGADCHGYRDGLGAERLGLRHSAEYKRWRYDVYLRDSFTCQDCGDDRGGNLHAHHLKPFANYPALRFVVANGVTLCEDCHRGRHKSDG